MDIKEPAVRIEAAGFFRPMLSGRVLVQPGCVGARLGASAPIEERGALEIARRTAANCSRVFRYAIRCGIAERNPAETIGDVLAPREKEYFAAISPDELPVFLCALYANEACMGLTTRIAMRLMLLLFVRTSELIETPWIEIDLERGNWVIPLQAGKCVRSGEVLGGAESPTASFAA